MHIGRISISLIVGMLLRVRLSMFEAHQTHKNETHTKVIVWSVSMAEGDKVTNDFSLSL